MAWPRGGDYQIAVQNPRTAFEDPQLRASKVDTTPLGLPRPYAGGFTTTYRFRNQSQSWATRCFTRDLPDLQLRYAAIGRFICRHPASPFVPADCLPHGIRVGNTWYPIIKMDWIDGDTLNAYVGKNVSNPSLIAALLPEFQNLIQQLEQWHVVHGDLQHGNIVVLNGKLHLIDYDSLFVPELSNTPDSQIWGHVNYQHPGRNNTNSSQTSDRFPSIVIYLGLLATSVAPQLWRKYDNSENILFCREDFVDPANSQLLRDLARIPSLTVPAKRLALLCQNLAENVPTLQQFRTGTFAPALPTTPVPPVYSYRSQYPIVDGSNKEALLQWVGQRIEAIGQVTDFHSASTRYGQPYLFLNFGWFPNQTLTLVLWSETIDSFAHLGVSPNDYLRKWVSVTGVVSTYANRPQIVVEQTSQIHALSSELEAKQRLGPPSLRKAGAPPPAWPSPKTVYRTPPQMMKGEEDFSGRLTSNPPTASPPHLTTPSGRATAPRSSSSQGPQSISKREADTLRRLYGDVSPTPAPAPKPYVPPPQPRPNNPLRNCLSLSLLLLLGVSIVTGYVGKALVDLLHR